MNTRYTHTQSRCAATWDTGQINTFLLLTIPLPILLLHLYLLLSSPSLTPFAHSPPVLRLPPPPPFLSIYPFISFHVFLLFLFLQVSSNLTVAPCPPGRVTSLYVASTLIFLSRSIMSLNLLNQQTKFSNLLCIAQIQIF